MTRRSDTSRSEGMPRLSVLAPLAIEAAALRRGGAPVRRAGTGPDARVPDDLGDAVVIAGTCGAVTGGLAAGDLVVASEVRTVAGDRVPLPQAAPLVAALRRRGLTVHHGPVVSARRVVNGSTRDRLAADGAIAVDTESGWWLPALDGRPTAVLRAVVDTPDHGLLHPQVVTAGVAALGALRDAAPALDEWASAVGPRRVLLAGPRSFCAGVDRAIEIVEKALDRHGPPVYVRKQIVHNAHVVADLEARGAVFVDELDEVPDGALTVFSAHGVSPAVRDDAADRGLQVIDATCPLVEKVHAEARRYDRDGYDILLVGHDGHEEVEGTAGEAPAAMHVVNGPDDADHIDVRDPSRVAVLSQTTLAVDEVDSIVTRLRERFPQLAAPHADDICYATQNRQDAVRAVAAEADLVLVVGSTNSSNSRRLVEVAQREGCAAHLVDDASEVDPRWLAGAATIGLTAGASAPEALVQDLVACLAGLGDTNVAPLAVTSEDVQFTLPKQLR